MKPYCYKLYHIPTNTYYIGSQYGKKSNSENLFKTYFTSSKYVNALIKKYGIDSFIIKKIIERNDARNYEHILLKRLYRIFGKTKFINIMINRNISPGIILTDEIIQKSNEKRKISNSVAAYKLLERGIHNFQRPRVYTEEYRKDLSVRNIGNKYGKNRIIDDDLRIKIGNSARGNKNVRGKSWWNNGIINKRSFIQPDETFIKGMITPLNKKEKIT